jgi:alanyl-tRNA synthetase
MKSSEIRNRFLKFFEEKNHFIIPSSSLVPQNDPSVLFNTAGMQPLVPYLMGEKHPGGNRLASSQKCVRTVDIEEVGNHKNLTFFEMLGNWSLGDYFKEDAIKWSFEFLTSKDKGLGLDKDRLYVTVFEGDEDAPRDLEAVEIWKKYINENRIYFLPKKNNWWSPGDNGPSGPDTEMFYDVTENGLGDLTHDEYVIADDKGEVVEIWNDVFMEYEKKDGRVIGKLNQKNVDTGSGLERITMIVQGKSNVYESDFFIESLHLVKEKSEFFNEIDARIVLDHLRTSLFLIGDGVLPSNKDQGYILRRIIRRLALKMKKLSLSKDNINLILNNYKKVYADYYPEILGDSILNVILEEFTKFEKTLVSGLKEFEKGVSPFILLTTYGFPFELTKELLLEKCLPVDVESFNKEMKEHQEKSKVGSEQKFKGGLANTSDETIKLHTTHHLLLKALQTIVDPNIHQRGSNITDERLRIDFSFDRKLSAEEILEVENLVNLKIKESLVVEKLEMHKDEAINMGAEMEFGAKYPDIVSVYVVREKDGVLFSKEFCGGPHVENTSELGTFKIQKEEGVAKGIRRIKAVLL